MSRRVRDILIRTSLLLHPLLVPHLLLFLILFFFFFNDRAPPEFYPLPLHDALPISSRFEPLARRIRHAWSHGLAPLPSSLDFENAIRLADDALDAAALCPEDAVAEPMARPEAAAVVDRKSTRLNSSHSQISYAVFCL